MKHLLFALTLSFAAFAASAQVSAPQTSSASQETAVREGNWIIGGTLGSTNFNFDTETFDLRLEPNAAYFISDNVAVGALVGFGLTAYDGGHVINYRVAPMIRYYFPEGATPTSRWFAEGTAGVGGSHMKDSDEDEPVNLVLGISGGYTHFVTSSVALEAKLGYTYSKADINSSAGWSGIGLGLGFQIYLPSRGNR